MGNIETPHLREYGFRKYPKYVCLWNPESGKFQNLGFEMWNTAQGIRNPTKRWNLQSEIYWERIRYPRRRIQNPRLSWIPLLEDRICMDFLKRFILTVFQSFCVCLSRLGDTFVCQMLRFCHLQVTWFSSWYRKPSISKKKSFCNNVRLKKVQCHYQ